VGLGIKVGQEIETVVESCKDRPNVSRGLEQPGHG
jgi:hypothetical protein